jgi:5-methylcytosine-specific restriction protein A
MPSKRTCTVCGAVTPRGRSRCEQHTSGWDSNRSRRLPSDWYSIRETQLHWHRDCAVCGAPATTVDHILARAFGGDDSAGNLQSLCAACAKVKDAADRREGARRRRGAGGRT